MRIRNLSVSIVLLTVFLGLVIAQTGAGAGLQQKVAAVKQSVAENQQKLHQYK